MSFVNIFKILHSQFFQNRKQKMTITINPFKYASKQRGGKEEIILSKLLQTSSRVI